MHALQQLLEAAEWEPVGRAFASLDHVLIQAVVVRVGRGVGSAAVDPPRALQFIEKSTRFQIEMGAHITTLSAGHGL